MNGHSLSAALAAAAGVGLAFGVANGVLVVTLGLPPFVATLGTLGIAQGLALVLTGGQSVVGIGDALPALSERRIAGEPFSIVVALAAFLAFWWMSSRTRVGAYVSALGGNREALTLAGVHAGLFHVSL